MTASRDYLIGVGLCLWMLGKHVAAELRDRPALVDAAVGLGLLVLVVGSGALLGVPRG